MRTRTVQNGLIGDENGEEAMSQMKQRETKSLEEFLEHLSPNSRVREINSREKSLLERLAQISPISQDSDRSGGVNHAPESPKNLSRDGSGPSRAPPGGPSRRLDFDSPQGSVKNVLSDKTEKIKELVTKGLVDEDQLEKLEEIMGKRLKKKDYQLIDVDEIKDEALLSKLLDLTKNFVKKHNSPSDLTHMVHWLSVNTRGTPLTDISVHSREGTRILLRISEVVNSYPFSLSFYEPLIRDQLSTFFKDRAAEIFLAIAQEDFSDLSAEVKRQIIKLITKFAVKEINTKRFRGFFYGSLKD